jgi:hypothetical protein
MQVAKGDTCKSEVSSRGSRGMIAGQVGHVGCWWGTSINVLPVEQRTQPGGTPVA